jgi:succinoglycan biosynthesis transport protein ExoP
MADFDAAFYLSIFRRRLPYFLAIVALVAAAGVVITYALPLVYRATAKILVESPQIPTDLARSTVPTGAVEQFQIIQEDVLSRQNLLVLADRFSIYRDRKDLSQSDILDDMQARIAIDPVRLEAGGGSVPATVFHISFDAGQPDLAANVVNDIVSMILRKDVELRTGRASDTVQFFNQEVARLDGELKALDGTILKFKNDHIDALPDSLDFRRNQQSAQQQRLLLLTQEESSLRRRQADLQTRHYVAGATPSTPEEKSLDDVRQALAGQLAVFNENSPAIKALRARIAALETQISTRRTTPSTDANSALPPTDADLELASVNDRLSAVTQEEASIAKGDEVLTASIVATPNNETALNSLERNHQNLQAQYNSAVSRLAEASTGQQIELRLKGERLSLIESAVPPQTPISPKRRILLAVTLVAALALGLGAILLPELLNKSIRRPVELINKMDIRPMITIPYITTTAEKNRKRVTSLVMVTALVAAIPLLLFALHAYVAPAEAVVSKAMSGIGLTEDNGNG